MTIVADSSLLMLGLPSEAYADEARRRVMALMIILVEIIFYVGVCVVCFLYRIMIMIVTSGYGCCLLV
jgi:hypothetical protein